MWKNILKPKNFLSFIFILILIMIGFLGFVIYRVFNEPPPQLFPLGDPQAIYRILKKNDLYWISYKTTSEMNKAYTCTWDRQNQESCQWELNQNVEGYIAASDYDLDQFLGVPLQVSGVFVYTKQQCMAKKCQSFAGSVVGFKVDSINIKP